MSGSPIIDPACQTLAHKRVATSGLAQRFTVLVSRPEARQPHSRIIDGNMITGTRLQQRSVSEAAQEAVLLMARIISHNDEFRVASHTPLETIVRDMCRYFYRRLGWRPLLSIEFTERQYYTQASRFGNSVTTNSQFQPDNTWIALLLVPVRLGKCKAGKANRKSVSGHILRLRRPTRTCTESRLPS